uniref:Putative glycosyltransferase n=1 Tax=viral metagenome TaxID=1070528 RepID=A0A6M3IWP5_9ZZZZ
MNQTVGMAIIARNVESTIVPCVESFITHVDECAIVLAGESTDKTEQLVKGLERKYPHLHVHNFKWVDDFSAARNYSFGRLHTSWGLWCDADDTIEGAENLRKMANNAPQEYGAFWFPYNYAHDEFGSVLTLYERERLLRMSQAWVWSGRLHETVSPIYECKYARTGEVKMIHNHLAGAPRHDRNMKLLKIMLEENPADKRIWLYLGHQNFASMNWMDASMWYLKFGQDSGALPLERYQALCYASKAMRSMNDFKQALDIAMVAIEIYPDYKDGYLEAAHSYMMMNEMDKAIHFAELVDMKGVMKETPSVIFVNPMDYTFRRCSIIAECYEKKGDLENALKYAQMAYGYSPYPQLASNIQGLKARMMREKATEAVRILAIELVDNNETIKLKALQEATPHWFRELPDYQQLIQGVNHHVGKSKSEPDIYENGDECVVNLRKAYGLSELLNELDKKYKKVTIISPRPNTRTEQNSVLSQADFETLMVEGDRHIVNLRSENSRIWCEYDHVKPEGMFIKFYVGKGLEHWSPQTIRTQGCGGSETAVAKVADAFSKHGHAPIVYAMDNQIWNGVMYRHHDKFAMPECDWFISSRIPELFNNDFNAGQKWLWVHDIHCWDRLTPEIAEQIDVIVTLSHWHADFFKRVYPFLKDAEVIDMDDQDKTYEDLLTPNKFHENEECVKLPKIAIIGNGLDTGRYKNVSRKKVKHSFIWLSSPDRGLEELLQLWPMIRERMSDATIKIFYGWNYFDSSLMIPSQREFKERIRKLIQQEGVQWCERVSQPELAIEMGKAEALLYPPHDFRETYGIAFLEAQAAETIVFYRQNGALGETVNDRGIPIPLDMKPEQIVDLVASTLDNSKLCNTIKAKGREYAMSRTWENQANKFLKLYQDISKCKNTK